MKKTNNVKILTYKLINQYNNYLQCWGKKEKRKKHINITLHATGSGVCKLIHELKANLNTEPIDAEYKAY